jgi:hypothetical protein
MTKQDRRGARRFPIRVLVKCLPPGVPRQRNGHSTRGWEMWAQDIADDGVGLQWSKAWAVQRCPSCSIGLALFRKESRRICLCQPPEGSLKKGQKVELDGLIYTEKGSKPMKGRIQWVRPSKKGDTFKIGVHIMSPNHRSFFRALEP